MTDKQIIIDGVDVSGCCDLDEKSRCKGKNLCSAEYCDFKFDLLVDEVKHLQAEIEEKNIKIRVLQMNRLTMFEHLNIVEENKKLKEENSKLRDLLKKAKEGADAYEYCIKELEKENERLRKGEN